MARNDRIVIRSARPADEQDIVVLAVLDGGRQMPKGHVLVAEVDGRIRAAVGSNGAAISDPFWPSAELVSMLRVHAGVANHTPRGALRFDLRRLALSS